mmetsp:Transcript_28773/g.70957  ORF Transcript_28773/g.70957 Transcript_28773/m.70957 type:complete len:212 (-) Transcript_28773:187-822(-)
MQRRHDDAPPHLPHLSIRRDQTRAHDELEDLGQQPLGEAGGLHQQYLPRHIVVRHHHELLGPDGQHEHLAVRQEQLVQGDEHRLPGYLADVARRDGHLAHGFAAPLPGQLRQLHRQPAALRQPSLLYLLSQPVEQHLRRAHLLLGELAGRDAVLQGHRRLAVASAAAPAPAHRRAHRRHHGSPAATCRSHAQHLPPRHERRLRGANPHAWS